MTWDLRSKYAFDASEGQIPEGQVSVYGPANSHANCVPASFTAALDLAGFGDIDPQRLTNEIYGPNYRGGFGDFSRTIRWIAANVSNAPAFTDGPFDFDTAEAAGQNGRLIIVAGWINAASVTFTAQSMANGFSHASLLVGHFANDQFLIWNTWTGQFQTYSRAVLAASLYEMSVMGPTGGIDLATADDIMAELNIIHQGLFGRDPAVLTPPIQDQLAMVYTQLKTPVTPGGVADLLLTRTQTILDNIAKLTTTAPGVGLNAQQQQLLQEVHDVAMRIETALKGA